MACCGQCSEYRSFTCPCRSPSSHHTHTHRTHHPTRTTTTTITLPPSRTSCASLSRASCCQGTREGLDSSPWFVPLLFQLTPTRSSLLLAPRVVLVTRSLAALSIVVGVRCLISLEPAGASDSTGLLFAGSHSHWPIDYLVGTGIVGRDRVFQSTVNRRNITAEPKLHEHASPRFPRIQCIGRVAACFVTSSRVS